MSEEWWVIQLRTWRANGTFERMDAAEKAEQPVQVKRSDGTISIGVLDQKGGGFGGRLTGVRVETEDGPRWKGVNTDDFLELNPGFGPHLKELETK